MKLDWPQRLSDSVRARQLVRKLSNALKTGVVAGIDDPPDPRDEEQWRRHRTIAADALRDLIADRAYANDPPVAVLLSGLQISGPLVLNGLHLECPLVFVRCYFTDLLALNYVRLRSLHIVECVASRIDAEQIETRGDLDVVSVRCAAVRLPMARVGGALSLSGSTLTGLDGEALNADASTIARSLSCAEGFSARGTVRLVRAHVGGSVDLDGASLASDGAEALCADGLRVEASVYGSELVATGEIRLLGAHVGSQVVLTGARVTCSRGVALFAERLTIGLDLKLGRLQATGQMQLRRAAIRGELELNGATLSNPDGTALDGDEINVHQGIDCGEGVAVAGQLRLRSAVVSGNVHLKNLTFANTAGCVLDMTDARVSALTMPDARPKGAYDFTGTTVGQLDDDPSAWPVGSQLAGLTYETLKRSDAVPERLEWIQRLATDYEPQVFEQLGTYYRSTGREESARTVAVANQRGRRAHLHPAAKLWDSLLYWTVGYGYRTWRAGLWLLAFWAIGWVIFAHAQMQAVKPATEVPAFAPGVYALDVLLPIVDFGQQGARTPIDDWARSWLWLSIIAGWVLTTAVVAALSGLLNRD